MTVNELKTAIKVLKHIDNLNEDPDIDFSMNIIIDLLRNILLESN
jgi:hypothetical protein